LRLQFLKASKALSSFHVPSASTLTVGLKVTVTIAVVIAIFHQDLLILANDALQSDLTSYILVIPFLFTYLVYRKRKMLGAVITLESHDQPNSARHLPTVAGILLTLAAIMLYWHSSYTFTPLEYHMLTLPILVTGLTLIFFNAQTLRQLAFPFAFLVLLTPPPSEILRVFGAALSVIGSEASYALVSLLGIPSTLTTEYGNPVIKITAPNGSPMSFTVGIACSGIYSLVGFLVFAFFIGYIIRDKPWKKLALFVTGLGLIYALNITRITAILLIGYNYGEETALQLFHLLGGWILIFIGTLLLLTFSEKVFRARIFSKPTKQCSACDPKPSGDRSFCATCGMIVKHAPAKFHRTDVAKIVAILGTAVLLVSIQVPVFALTQGPAIILIDTPAGQQVSTEILPKISGYELKFASREREFETVAKQDMSLIYYYLPSNTTQKTVYATIEIASSRDYLYSWELCMKTGQAYPFGHQEVEQINLKDIQLVQDPPVIGRFFVFQYTSTNTTQAVLYWFESAAFEVNSTSGQKYMKISLITYPESLAELSSIENQTVSLATAITSYWQPIKTWSQIALLLSQNGGLFSLVAGALLSVITVFYLVETRKQRKGNLQAYQKLSTTSKELIDAVREAEKATKPTLHAIASTFKDRTGKPIEDEELLQRLSDAEGIGIIKSQIASIHDVPTQIWKSQMKLF
jgi:exosortase